MSARAQAKIDRIMSRAYDEAFKVLEAKVKAFMRAEPRFVEYFHAVGWGPAFVDKAGKHWQWSHEMTTKRGRAMLEFCDKFYDTYGAGNERVKP